MASLSDQFKVIYQQCDNQYYINHSVFIGNITESEISSKSPAILIGYHDNHSHVVHICKSYRCQCIFLKKFKRAPSGKSFHGGPEKLSNILKYVEGKELTVGIFEGVRTEVSKQEAVVAANDSTCSPNVSKVDKGNSYSITNYLHLLDTNIVIHKRQFCADFSIDPNCKTFQSAWRLYIQKLLFMSEDNHKALIQTCSMYKILTSSLDVSIHALLQVLGDDISIKLHNIHDWFYRLNPKANCLYFWDQNIGNTYKSTVARSLGQLAIIYNEISNEGFAYDFKWSCLAYSRLCIWNEATFNKCSINFLKQLFGGDDLTIQIKGCESELIKPIPILCTSNQPWESLFDNNVHHLFYTRIFDVEFFTVPDLGNIVIDPLAWMQLFYFNGEKNCNFNTSSNLILEDYTLNQWK